MQRLRHTLAALVFIAKRMQPPCWVMHTPDVVYQAGESKRAVGSRT